MAADEEFDAALFLMRGPVDAAQAAVDSIKRKSKAKACCALWGGTLHDLEGDDGRPMLIVTRWEMTRTFHGMDALDQAEQFLRQVGAPGA